MTTQANILRLLQTIRPHTCSIPKVRIGRRGDGGYVVNDDFEGIRSAISLGIAGEISFDLELASRGIKVYQYDPNVDALPVPHDNFAFRKLAWGDKDDSQTRTLLTMLKENNIAEESDLLLKFDVEGAEWAALKATSPSVLRKFRIITAEFHNFEALRDERFFGVAAGVLSLLWKTHVVTHLHPNNTTGLSLVEGIPLPSLLELSFLRRDRSEFFPSSDPMPSPLDYPNVPNLPEIILTPFS